MSVYASTSGRMINFCIEHQNIKPDLKGYESWLSDVVAQHKRNISQLTYILSSDQEILELNRSYLNHDFYTDVLTFELGENEEIIGDIFISLDRVKENAEEEGFTFEEELRRVMIHGVLHLLGYDDSTEKERKEMRDLEDRALEMFHVKQ